ncbi:hypothetical protein [Enterococcus dongliensis]|uniref:hypothetical protein n=1 Tax=Enterococcus dongliensis TaxID=2559925 RepID=UPI002890FE74|nr:hypothetical protein [Enterococcus dongliensis]MDT2669629.1 hypothetical protein [Enterococcus dongliensis]MDT2674622.1 hypothetical protein [Enterococcus dongliensis]MDT2703599.1 hypothetical protein [Enterococcus dongliensis]
MVVCLTGCASSSSSNEVKSEKLSVTLMEVTPEGETVFDVDLTDFPTSAWAYRAERFSLYNANWQYQVQE